MADNDVTIRLKLEDAFSAAFSAYRRDLAGARNETKAAASGMASSLDGIKSAFSAIGKSVVVFNQGVELMGRFAGAVKAAAAPFVTVNSQLENARVRLTALSGSTETAAKELEFLQGVAAKVPFTMQNVIDAGVTLKAFGADVEQWTPAVTDLAVVMGTDVKEAADAMGRAFAGGAGAADILRERGVLELVKSFAKVDDLTKLSLPQFREALLGAMVDPAGKIAGAARLAADTWDGKMSMISDATDRFRLAMTQRLWPAAQQTLQGILDKVAEFERNGQFQEWAKMAETSVIKLWNAIVAGAAPVIKTVGFITQAGAGLVAVWDGVKFAIQGVIVGATTLANVMTANLVEANRLAAASAKEVFDKFGKDLEKSAGNVLKIKDTTAELAKGAEAVGAALKIALGEETNAAIESTNEQMRYMDNIIKLNTEDVGALAGGWVGAGIAAQGAVGAGTVLMTASQQAAADAKAAIEGIGTSSTAAAKESTTAAISMASAIRNILEPQEAIEKKNKEIIAQADEAAKEYIKAYGTEGLGAAYAAATEAGRAWGQNTNATTEQVQTYITSLQDTFLAKIKEINDTPISVTMTDTGEKIIAGLNNVLEGGTAGIQLQIDKSNVRAQVDGVLLPIGEGAAGLFRNVGAATSPLTNEMRSAASATDSMAMSAQRAANVLNSFRATKHHAGYWPDGAKRGEHAAVLRNDEVVTPPEKFREHGMRMLREAGRFRSERSSLRAGGGGGPTVNIQVKGFVSRDVVRDLSQRMNDALRWREISFQGAR